MPFCWSDRQVYNELVLSCILCLSGRIYKSENDLGDIHVEPFHSHWRALRPRKLKQPAQQQGGATVNFPSVIISQDYIKAEQRHILTHLGIALR